MESNGKNMEQNNASKPNLNVNKIILNVHC